MSDPSPISAMPLPNPEERAAIDRSCRLPVLAFALSAVGWLLLHTVLAVISSYQLHVPELFADSESLTHGRLAAAHMSLLVYGWGSMAGIACVLWLQGRLSGVPLVRPGLATAAALIWNLGVLAGLGAILAGDGSGVLWLEFPIEVNAIIGIAMLLVAVTTLATFMRRRPGHLYVSQWYLFGAVLWLPLIFVIANLAIHRGMTDGVVQAAATWWFGHNLITLWFTPVALAAAYYFLPAVSGKPIASYSLSLLGFWTLALFATWAGAAQLVGGPVPAWLATVGVTSSVLMLVPVITVGLNHHLTLAGDFGKLRSSIVLRFLFAGGIAYSVYGALVALLSLRGIAETTQFTLAMPGNNLLGIYGFTSLIMFGGLYYIIPRLTDRAWHSPWLIKVHFWCAVVGISTVVLALLIGGWLQGSRTLDDSLEMRLVADANLVPLWARSMGLICLALGHIAFAISVVRQLLPAREPTPLELPESVRAALAE